MNPKTYLFWGDSFVSEVLLNDRGLAWGGTAIGGRGHGVGYDHQDLVVRLLAWGLADGCVWGSRQASVVPMGMDLPSSVLALVAALFWCTAAKTSVMIHLRVGQGSIKSSVVCVHS